jgi:hypothetical protein
MAMSKALGDREYQKFVETTEGNTAVRTKEDDRPETYDSEGKLTVTDDIVVSLLHNIRTELKKINLYLSKMSDLELEPGDENECL